MDGKNFIGKSGWIADYDSDAQTPTARLIRITGTDGCDTQKRPILTAVNVLEPWDKTRYLLTPGCLNEDACYALAAAVKHYSHLN